MHTSLRIQQPSLGALSAVYTRCVDTTSKRMGTFTAEVEHQRDGQRDQTLWCSSAGLHRSDEPAHPTYHPGDALFHVKYSVFM